MFSIFCEENNSLINIFPYYNPLAIYFIFWYERLTDINAQKISTYYNNENNNILLIDFIENKLKNI